MKNLCNIRIDERFIHGQILLTWMAYLNCNNVIILDDNVSCNPIMSRVMKMSVPNNISIDILNLNDGIEYLKSVRESSSTIVLIRNLETLWELYKVGFTFNKVNIARLPFSVGKQLLCKNIYVDLKEKEIIKKLIDEGVELSVQMVPDCDAFSLNTLFK